MKLYSSPASPFARKARTVIHELGLADQVEIVDTQGTALAPGTHPTALNPLSKIPVLERSDGPALYDSRVITRYLDTLAGGGLYPAAPRLWDTLTLEALADGIMEAALLMVYEARLRPEATRSADWVEAQWGKVASAIAALERTWLSHLQGRTDMGHLALACALGYVDFRLPDRDWRGTSPGLATWYETAKLRPSLAATTPS
ncbi:glutathione S-transferase [Ovoidimarina sediminis]|uniref:glutathione S-transferase n=1 Tax=Ovoidimarina sediminis TaxID=3079856 RepID=UPI002909E10D|nr:glutathione S-transferase [Rhodophyticola sp. MJ-SS7]MDU8942331.1 glutathione S-transferase [Rhodophyticola sp. MJ-SS7]